MQANNWYEPLRAIRSLGSNKSKIANLGQLAEARKKHLGQFFTPDHIAAFMWSLVKSVPIASILDNSIGSGRLLQFADPAKHSIFGVDVHAETVDHVKSVFESAGFNCEIHCSGMEYIQPRSICLGIINPPFSIHLESPFLTEFSGGTRMGKFGPNSSSTSDDYALLQALAGCGIVIALLPRTRAIEIAAGVSPWGVDEVKGRLIAVFDLPANSFSEESTAVSTSVVVFGAVAKQRDLIRIQLKSTNDQIPDLCLGQEHRIFLRRKQGRPTLRLQSLNASEPSITLPVTGNKSVRVCLDGRKIKLQYSCGLVQAKVDNAILWKRISSNEHVRLPKGVRYDGEGKLDLEVYLCQSDPVAAFNRFMNLINDAGGIATPAPGVFETFRKRAKQQLRLKVPLRHVIWTKGASGVNQLNGVAKTTHNADPTVFLSPVIKTGTELTFNLTAPGRYGFDIGSRTYQISLEDLEANFDLKDVSEGWKVIHEGLRDVNVERFKMWSKRFSKLGLEKLLSWNFQREDAIELVQLPASIVGWQQATGKTRLAVALILLSGIKHGLIVLESRLAGELIGQLERIGFDMDLVNFIDSPEKLTKLNQVNVISYERLRSLVDPDHSKRITYAHKLRRRIGMILPDEGEKIANRDSEQTKALFQVAARKRFILTGTPQANYCRDMHGLMLFVGGDGTALQPYGHQRGFLEENWIHSMEYSRRGQAAIMNDFVTVDWVTWEFTETLRKGAKREIPKIANVEKYRQWLSPFLKRRLVNEPEVAAVMKLPPLIPHVEEVTWDENHLAYYLRAADEFAAWYKNQDESKKGNLGLVLARLQVVHKALNCPQAGAGSQPPYVGLTSKQRWMVNKITQAVALGRKMIMYTENPETIRVIGNELAKLEIDFVPFHGRIPIAKRVQDKDVRFVNGKTQVLLATKPSARAGYNLPMADDVLFFDRSWSARIEAQAVRRPLRVERKHPVNSWFVHLPGGLDIYQDQMVAFKSDSERSGIDYGVSELENEEFLHMSVILERFVDDLAKLHGTTANRFRETLKYA